MRIPALGWRSKLGGSGMSLVENSEGPLEFGKGISSIRTFWALRTAWKCVIISLRRTKKINKINGRHLLVQNVWGFGLCTDVLTETSLEPPKFTSTQIWAVLQVFCSRRDELGTFVFCAENLLSRKNVNNSVSVNPGAKKILSWNFHPNFLKQCKVEQFNHLDSYSRLSWDQRIVLDPLSRTSGEHGSMFRQAYAAFRAIPDRGKNNFGRAHK